jgi:hypothetical protein
VTALISKPGITRLAVSSGIPKDWSQSWFRDFASDYLKGADVRNAVGANGVTISGNITSPYATIGLASPLTFPGTLIVRAGGPIQLEGNGAVVPILQVNGTTGPTIQGYGPVAGALVDMTPDSGTFTTAAAGFTGTVNVTVVWRRIGNVVTINITNFSGTSNATSFNIPNTNTPASIKPTAQQSFNIPGLEDNGGTATSTNTFVQILTDGTIRFILGGSVTGWTAAGTKGLVQNVTFSYYLA